MTPEDELLAVFARWHQRVEKLAVQVRTVPAALFSAARCSRNDATSAAERPRLQQLGPVHALPPQRQSLALDPRIRHGSITPEIPALG
jgi:hypothetical protein